MTFQQMMEHRRQELLDFFAWRFRGGKWVKRIRFLTGVGRRACINIRNAPFWYEDSPIRLRLGAPEVYRMEQAAIKLGFKPGRPFTEWDRPEPERKPFLAPRRELPTVLSKKLLPKTQRTNNKPNNKLVSLGTYIVGDQGLVPLVHVYRRYPSERIAEPLTPKRRARPAAPVPGQLDLALGD